MASLAWFSAEMARSLAALIPVSSRSLTTGLITGLHPGERPTMAENSSVNRRDFVKQAAGFAAALGVAAQASGAPPAKASAGRVVGATDRIQVGVIGVGGRGS